MDIFHMSDIIPLIGLPYPPYGRSNYNVPCPCCDDEPHAKHLNINLQKNVFRCPRCGFSGGIFDLYAYYTGIAREEVRDALIARLDVQGSTRSFRMPHFRQVGRPVNPLKHKGFAVLQGRKSQCLCTNRTIRKILYPHDSRPNKRVNCL